MHKIHTGIPSGIINLSISAECVDHQGMSIQSLYQNKSIINRKHKNNLTLTYNITPTLINLSAIIFYHFHQPAHHGSCRPQISPSIKPGDVQIASHKDTKLWDHYCQILYPNYMKQNYDNIGSRISSVINNLSISASVYPPPANEGIILVTKQYHYFQKV